MKHIILTLAILCVTLVAAAQDNSTEKSDAIGTLFGRNRDVKLGWFIGSENSYTQFGSRDVHISGFNAGLIIDHNFTNGFRDPAG